jgi:hypothetical protein
MCLRHWKKKKSSKESARKGSDKGSQASDKQEQSFEGEARQTRRAKTYNAVVVHSL